MFIVLDSSQSFSDSRRIAIQLGMGDQSSLWRFTEVLRPYLKQVIRSQLKGKLPEKFDESDVVQSALTQAVRCIDQFHGHSEEEWKAWLAEICRNESKNAIRHWLSRRRDVKIEKALDHPEGLPSPSQTTDEIERQENTRKIMQGIESLNEDQQRLVRLRHFDNLPHKEVARELGITEEAARRRWFLTLKKLKEIVNKLNVESGSD